MRLFLALALAAAYIAFPGTAHASSQAGLQGYAHAPKGYDGEPPSAILLITGVGGMALVLRRRQAAEQ